MLSSNEALKELKYVEHMVKTNIVVYQPFER